MSSSFLSAAAIRATDAADSVSTSTTDDDTLAALKPFFSECRVRSAVFKATGRGMACIEAADEGTTLLAVPLDCCWTADAARDLPELAALGTEVLDAIAPENLIALHLLIVLAQPTAPPAISAVGVRCRWAHAQLLSATPIEVLWDWSDEELKDLLQGSKWALAPGWARNDVLADLDEWKHYLPLAELFVKVGITEQKMLWAHKVSDRVE